MLSKQKAKEIMMNNISVEDVLQIINKTDENLNIKRDQIGENLLDLGLDSIKFIQMVVAIEEAFDCEIPDSKLIMSEMDTVEKIMAVLTEL